MRPFSPAWRRSAILPARALLHRAAEALKPFAHFLESVYDDQADDDSKEIDVSVGDLRRAAALIRELESRLAL